MISSINPGSNFSIITDFIIYLTITAHLCLFIDISPLQKYPTCKLNYILASILAAVVASIITASLPFASHLKQLLVGSGIASIVCVPMILSIQCMFDIDIDF